jgi:hypothetical protein
MSDSWKRKAFYVQDCGKIGTEKPKCHTCPVEFPANVKYAAGTDVSLGKHPLHPLNPPGISIR